ncbi:Uma2 family endonuclease [Ammoniphilus sp. CFH 90114]|uniref:Uma2 family endonuclease n=1 Tax=Ammoniphilus sp. CFH 90114 TaxID=2493665 RepID=UPI00100EDD55|nr:Uma2 family endonuclease [Ammoniphilus sp. CFH 90114]RXT00075.1 Uma2 family endonuclease [Ammoniphilus sp. CFH 90114]
MERLNVNQRYTVEEFLKFDLKEGRYELHEGFPILMSPASAGHEAIVASIIGELSLALKGSQCTVFGSNLAVIPFGSEVKSWEKEKFFLPDISVLCDHKKIQQGKCYGAPDLVVEVLSPSTSRTDLVTKLNDYERAGVREYWIVDPSNQFIAKYVLTHYSFVREDVFDMESDFSSTIFSEIRFAVNDIFHFYNNFN